MDPGLPASPSHPADRRIALTALTVGLILHFSLSLVGWNHTLLEAHEFRQAQTALSARAMAAGDWRMDYPLPLFGPPWSAPFEFPIYQGVVAALAAFSGWPLEQCGRAVSLLFFYLALPALYLAQENLPIPRARRGWLPALVALSPVYLFYSRAFMIESCALCAGAWFLFAYGRALRRTTIAWIVAAGLLGGVAGLAKSTTFVVFLTGAAGLTVRAWLEAQRTPSPGGWRRVLLPAAALLPALLATLAWTRYADAVKESNALAAALSSHNLQGFILGDWQTRAAPEAWIALGRNLLVAVFGGANAMLAAVLGLLWPGRRLAFVALAACFAAAPLLFFSLHAVHDYYFYASGVFALAALCVGWSNLLDAPGVSRQAGCAVIVLSLLLQLGSYHATYGALQRQPSRPVPELARILAATTTPEEIVLLVGEDWNPVVPYYAARRAIMVTDESARHPGQLERVLESLPPHDRVAALVVAGEHRKQADWIRRTTQKLGLAALPAAMSSNAAIYLSDAASAVAGQRLPALGLNEFTAVAGSTDELNIPRHRYSADRLSNPRLAQVVPAHLREIVHPFDLAVHEIDGAPVLDAHAPTDVVLDLPPGKRQLVIEFGILPGAWQAERPTDGMEFRIELAPAQGAAPAVIGRRFIDPVARAGDRGRQSLTLELPPGAAGELRLRTLPGPTNSISCDWGYWRRIELR